MDLTSEKEDGCAGITTFRIKYPNQASFWFQTWYHGPTHLHKKEVDSHVEKTKLH